MSLLWIGMLVMCIPAILFGLFVLGLYGYVQIRYMEQLLRIFGEKPLFIIPRGEPRPGAEEITFRTQDGLTLRGCYIKSDRPRRGVILFGVEYGSNRWSCVPYCEQLIQAGYDVFSYEPRNQGESEKVEGYEPIQWLTRYEYLDAQAAISYLKTRTDADPGGIAIFGISKGANAGLMAAAKDPFVRCVVTDGAFGTYSTMVPYMRKWISLYSDSYRLQEMLPRWFYGMVALSGMRKEGRRRNVRFLHVENAVRRFDRPLLMIHGGNDTYIKVDMAREIYNQAKGPKDFWIVDGARHNQAMHVAGQEYAQRIISFLDYHLAGIDPGTTAIGNTITDPIRTQPESAAATQEVAANR